VFLRLHVNSKIIYQHSLPESFARTGEAIVNHILFFFLDEKETKNQDLGFSAIKIGSLPKTQKLPRSQTRGLKQFEFLYGSFSFLILACQIQWSEKSPEVLLWILEFGISVLEFLIRAFVAKS
jgi:hypothetical protein